jgi:hypothetical protein
MTWDSFDVSFVGHWGFIGNEVMVEVIMGVVQAWWLHLTGGN